MLDITYNNRHYKIDDPESEHLIISMKIDLMKLNKEKINNQKLNKLRELSDFIIELEDYFDDFADADSESINQEMRFLSKLKDINEEISLKLKSSKNK